MNRNVERGQVTRAAQPCYIARMSASPDAIEVAARLLLVREEIALAAEAAGRNPASVKLVAVTKTVAPEAIDQAIAQYKDSSSAEIVVLEAGPATARLQPGQGADRDATRPGQLRQGQVGPLPEAPQCGGGWRNSATRRC